TGRWEALESEVDDEAREATHRMRRFAPADDGISVDETPPQEAPRSRRADPVFEEAPPAPRSARAAAVATGAAAAATAAAAMPSIEDTQSSQTVINLDQADAIAEADFHVAYGLYDQAADLLTKALRSSPDRR